MLPAPQKTLVQEFLDKQKTLPPESPVISDPAVKKAITLCNGVQRLVDKGDTAGADQIVRANEAVLQRAIRILETYDNCMTFQEEARQLTALIQKNQALKTHTEYPDAVQSAGQSMAKGNYAEALQTYIDARARCKELSEQEYLATRQKAETTGGKELQESGGTSGTQLYNTFTQFEKLLNQPEFNPASALQLRLRMEELLPTAIQTARQGREKIEQELAAITGYKDALKFLDLQLKQNPDSPFLKHLKESVLANRRFQTGHRLQNKIGMNMIYLPPGSFTMGSESSEPLRDEDELPHTVTLNKGFFIGALEVTTRQWNLVMDRAASPGGNTFPKNNITWEDAVEFCRRLSEQEPGCIYRLPTEAEWEYACRAGSRTPFNTEKSALTANDAVIFDLQRPPQSVGPVGAFSANAWGLYDMHGNVAEWCQDWMAPYKPDDATNPHGPEDSAGNREFCGKVIRGGSWIDDPSAARSANRQSQLPVVATDTTGFRVVLEAYSVP